MPRRSRLARCCAVLAGAAVLVAVVAAPAAAHVSIDPASATRGSFAILAFSVPNERDDASTTEVAIQLPENRPIESVRYQPKPGWTVTTEKDGDRVTTITWSGGEIKPGEFDLFTISAGPLPKKGNHVEFKALQTYSDGEIVRWIDEAEEGAPEPEHPAPVLELTAKPKSGGDQGH